MNDDDIDRVVRHWRSLDKRLRSFDPDDVRLDLFVKERNLKSQYLTLEARVAGLPVLIASTSVRGFDAALHVVRDEMVRLIGDAKATGRLRNTQRFRSA